jgi:hypothetical protein
MNPDFFTRQPREKRLPGVCTNIHGWMVMQAAGKHMSPMSLHDENSPVPDFLLFLRNAPGVRNNPSLYPMKITSAGPEIFLTTFEV